MHKLKLLVASLSVIALAAACGKASSGGATCAGAHVATWASSLGKVTFKDSCAFAFASASGSCSSAGTYPAPLGASGQVAITIAAVSGGSGCLPVGSYTCAYTLNPTTLSFDCGNGAQTYTKQ